MTFVDVQYIDIELHLKYHPSRGYLLLSVKVLRTTSQDQSFLRSIISVSKTTSFFNVYAIWKP